jgi:hypothetical protein
MKLFSLALAVLVSSVVFGQVQIVSNDLPQANDVLITRGATLLDPSVDLEFTGPNQTWNFGFDVLQPLTNVTTTDCVPVETTPILYQFLFNNPFDNQHNSDFAFGTDDISAGAFTFEDVYNYYKNSSSVYANTGVGSTINGIPVPAQFNPVDIIYHLPIDYGDQDSTHSELMIDLDTLGAYQLVQDRVNFCSGWGTLNIYDQTFPVLKMRTEIYATDSIYIGFIGFGQAFERPIAVEYKWMTPAINVPVLQINANLINGTPVVTSIATADIYTGVNEEGISAMALYPNPTEEYIQLQGNQLLGKTYRIVGINGEQVATGKYLGQPIEVRSLASGMYFMIIDRDGKIQSTPFVKH